ncbi:MAG: ATP-dependent helicase [Anaerolineae bacterium]|nr:ATP-dependent helicase [Anaerolineae bacterium]
MFDQTIQLTNSQRDLIARPGRVFLEGAAGTGKTTVGVRRMLHLLQTGVPADEILVLVPQHTLAQPYRRALRTVDLPPGGQVNVSTMSGIAIGMIELFWPLIGAKAGFAKPETLPTFLNFEAAQYVMAHIAAPLIAERGYFESVTMERSRLYIQMLDNLNKSAVVGFPHTEIGVRLRDAWLGDPAQANIFEQVQECATRFRAFCLQHNLLDFSLQMDVFVKYLWVLPACRDLLLGRYHHLIAENVEEENAAAQDIMREWLPHFESALVIYDSDAGYRSYLGADPDNGYTLRAACDQYVELTESFAASLDLAALGNELGRALDQFAEDLPGDPRAALDYAVSRFYPEMLDKVADEVRRLVDEESVPPGEIVVMAPLMPDALKFSLMQRLEGIPTRSHRPSRSLRDQPAVRCLLTLAQLAHPAWGIQPPAPDVAYALMQALGTLEPGKSLDLVRAQLLARDAYPDHESKSRLAPFDNLRDETQERISPVLGERYDALRGWLEDYASRHEPPAVPPEPKRKGRRKKKAEAEPPSPPEAELDHFFSLLFGEVLSQRGFGFYDDTEAADHVSNLVDSARDFRRTLGGKNIAGTPLGREYVDLVQRGVVGNQSLRQRAEGVLIAPAYTFLLANQPAQYQFWLDIGSRLWFERLNQPLTHAYVLSKQWRPGDKWTDDREFDLRRETLFRVALGLIRRCRQRVYFGISELGENGYEAQGELLRAFSRVLRRVSAQDNADQGEADV